MLDTASTSHEGTGLRLHALLTELFPLCRSLTGTGLRQTLARIGEEVPIGIREVASGTPIFDWTVPDEWNARAAYIETLDGRRLVDFADHNLHLVQYSVPVDAVVPYQDLRRHLYTLPGQPDLIPYRTNYYGRDWGFCLPHRRLADFVEPAYRVVIDAELGPGSMSYGELLVPGDVEEEVLISCHSCHPSLANDNLSGIVVAVELARRLMAKPHRLSYRFLFAPATVGALAWLSRNQAHLHRLLGGLVLTCVGDAGGFTYKRTRRGDASVDRAVAHVLRHQPEPWRTVPFEPFGYDERQYNSPGFDLPVGCFMRSPNGTFPEYHTSADNPAFVRPESLEAAVNVLERVLAVMDGNVTYRRTDGRGEPRLGKYGLYDIDASAPFSRQTVLWLLNLADGHHSVLDMAERAGRPFEEFAAAGPVLADTGLVEVTER